MYNYSCSLVLDSMAKKVTVRAETFAQQLSDFLILEKCNNSLASLRSKLETMIELMGLKMVKERTRLVSLYIRLAMKKTFLGLAKIYQGLATIYQGLAVPDRRVTIALFSVTLGPT